MIWWSHIHRVHHKYTDTDADPHNAKRGFFYSHMGWLLCRLHPLAKEKKDQLDISDLTNETILIYQMKVYPLAVLLLSLYLPIAIPVYLWGETWRNAYYINILRYIVGLNITFTINSFAHAFGNKPYDRFVQPIPFPLTSSNFDSLPDT